MDVFACWRPALLRRGGEKMSPKTVEVPNSGNLQERVVARARASHGSMRRLSLEGRSELRGQQPPRASGVKSSDSSGPPADVSKFKIDLRRPETRPKRVNTVRVRHLIFKNHAQRATRERHAATRATLTASAHKKMAEPGPAHHGQGRRRPSATSTQRHRRDLAAGGAGLRCKGGLI